MAAKRSTILMVAAGVFIFCLVVVLSLGAWFFASVFDATTVEAASVEPRFAEIRGRFTGGPVFAIERGHDARVVREPPAAPATTELRTIHVRHWKPDEQRLQDLALPFWLLRLKHLSFSVSSTRAGLQGVTAEQIERFGPALLVDYEDPGGERLLIWTE